MRKVRYSVAMSLDGFISGPNGEYDWIVMNPSVNFSAFYKNFDIVLMGRRTFEVAREGLGGTIPGMRTIVCTRTLQARDFPRFTVSNDAAATVSGLKTKPGKDIWLFGGGGLFRSLLDAHLVDTIEVSVMPILLSQGIPLLPAGNRSPPLRLIETKPIPSGAVGLTYVVEDGVEQRTG